MPWYYGNAKGVHVILETSGIGRLLSALDPKAEKILDVAAHNIGKEWKENIILQDAVDTGAYVGSVHVENSGPLQRTISDGVEYGVYIEHGTTKMPARPCATPAVEKERVQLEKAWEELFK